MSTKTTQSLDEQYKLKHPAHMLFASPSKDEAEAFSAQHHGDRLEKIIYVNGVAFLGIFFNHFAEAYQFTLVGKLTTWWPQCTAKFSTLQEARDETMHVMALFREVWNPAACDCAVCKAGSNPLKLKINDYAYMTHRDQEKPSLIGRVVSIRKTGIWMMLKNTNETRLIESDALFLCNADTEWQVTGRLNGYDNRAVKNWLAKTKLDRIDKNPKEGMAEAMTAALREGILPAFHPDVNG